MKNFTSVEDGLEIANADNSTKDPVATPLVLDVVELLPSNVTAELTHFNEQLFEQLCQQFGLPKHLFTGEEGYANLGGRAKD